MAMCIKNEAFIRMLKATLYELDQLPKDLYLTVDFDFYALAGQNVDLKNLAVKMRVIGLEE